VIRNATAENKQFENQLELLRSRIDAIDTELLETLSSRMEIVKQIGEYKRANNVTALQIGRFAELMEKRVKLGQSLNLDPHFVQQIFQHIHEDSVRMQTDIMDE
jgi:chorismate mutase